MSRIRRWIAEQWFELKLRIGLGPKVNPALCMTCQRFEPNEKIRVRDMNFDPPAEYHFCSIFCRNWFINQNNGRIKLDRDYGNTLARFTTGIPG